MDSAPFSWARDLGERMAMQEEIGFLRAICRQENPRDCSDCQRVKAVGKDYDGTIKPLGELDA